MKRVAAVAGERLPAPLWKRLGRDTVVPERLIAVLSDNPAGLDSRTWGYIAHDAIVGAVVHPRPGHAALGRQASQDTMAAP